MNWLYYLLEANLYMAMFYAVYLLILRNETYYTANRWYLLTTSLIAFALPLMQIGWLKPVEAVTQISFVNDNVSFAPTANGTNLAPVQASLNIVWVDVVLVVYALGAGLATILFLIKLVKLYHLVYKSHHIDCKEYTLVEIDEQNTGFSFFNYLFISKNQANKHTIITHEMVHIRQNHSADIIFIELLKIISWFNPLIYLLQNSLKTLHEYIADDYTATNETDNLTYSSFLLNNAYGLQGPAAANSFFNNNLLKNRIVMLNKPRSGSAARLKYLMAIPIAAGTLCLSTLSFSKDYATFDLYSGANEATATNPLNIKPNPADTGFRVPEPDVVKNDFTTLTTHLGKRIKFPAAEINKTKYAGLILSFDVDKAGTVGDVRLLAPAKNVLGNAAVSGFNTFSGKLNVKPGTYIMGVKFITLADKYPHFPEPAVTKNANFIGTVTILGMDAKQKINTQSKATAEKHIPNKPLNIPKPPVPIPAPKIERVYVKNTVDADLRAFNKHLSQTIVYPKTDYDNKVTGRVFAQIITDHEDKVKEVRVLRAPSETLENEVVRAIKSYKGKLPSVKSDHADYTVPISFNLVDKDDNNLSEKSIADHINTQSNANATNQNADNKTTDKVHYSLNEVAIIAYLPKN